MKNADYGKLFRWVCIGTAILTALLLVCSINSYEKQNALVEELTNNMTYFKDFSLPTVDGGSFSTEDLKGYKVTVVNGWAPWCGPCTGELPDLEELNREYSDKGLQVVGVVADYFSKNDSNRAAYDEEIAEIISSTGVTYPVMLSDNGFKNGPFPTMRNAFPCTWAVDQDGNVLETTSGARSADDWRVCFDKWLEEVN